jgi:4-amino-4-deoxy-L-arabinose transferase-like glycosyltransferase
MGKAPAGFLLALALLAGAFFPRAVTEGAFSDSLAYAAVARNLAEGIGSFWQPWFQQAEWMEPPMDRGFYAHPPLQYGLHSGIYRLLGGGWPADRVAAGLTFGLGALLLLWAWKGLALGAPALRGLGWMALAAWLLLPVVSWAAPYCMLESTMSLFCLAACGAVPRAGSQWRGWLLLCGLMTAGAFLVKGPAGLFPLAAPLGWWLLSRPKPYPLWGCALPLLPLALVGVALGLSGPSRAFFISYFEAQLLPSLGEPQGLLRGVPALLRNMLLEAGLLLGLGLLARLRLRGPGLDWGRASAWALWVGLSASLPLALSGKQHLYYLLPAAPWLALSVAAVLAPGLRAGWERLEQRRGRLLRGAAFALMAAVAAASLAQAGRPGRDAALLQMLHHLQARVPEREPLWLVGELHGHFGLHAYLARYGRWPLRCGGGGRYALSRGQEEAPSAGWQLAAEHGPWRLWEPAAGDRHSFPR